MSTGNGSGCARGISVGNNATLNVIEALNVDVRCANPENSTYVFWGNASSRNATISLNAPVKLVGDTPASVILLYGTHSSNVTAKIGPKFSATAADGTSQVQFASAVGVFKDGDTLAVFDGFSGNDADAKKAVAAYFASTTDTVETELALGVSEDGLSLVWQEVEGDPVAKIGDTTYSSLRKAAEVCAAEGGRIVLIDDAVCSRSVQFASAKDVTLDLAGHSVLGAGAIAPVIEFTGSGTLTIVGENASGGGSLISDQPSADAVLSGQATSSTYPALYSGATVVNSGVGTLNVRGVEIRGTFNAVKSTGTAATTATRLEGAVVQTRNGLSSGTLTDKQAVVSGNNVTLVNCTVSSDAKNTGQTAHAASARQNYYTELVSGAGIVVDGGTFTFGTSASYVSSSVFGGRSGNDVTLKGTIAYDLGGYEVTSSSTGGSGEATTVTETAQFVNDPTPNVTSPTPLKLAGAVKLVDTAGKPKPAVLQGYRGATVFTAGGEGVTLSDYYYDDSADGAQGGGKTALSALVVDANGVYHPEIAENAIRWNAMPQVYTYGATIGTSYSAAQVSYSMTYTQDGQTQRYAAVAPVTAMSEDGATCTLTVPETLEKATTPTDRYGAHLEWTGNWIVSNHASAPSHFVAYVNPDTTAPDYGEGWGTTVMQKDVTPQDGADGYKTYVVKAGAQATIDFADDNICIAPEFKRTQIPYRISYVLNGGTGAGDNTTSFTTDWSNNDVPVAAQKPSQTWTLADPVREGYSFDGWYYKNASGRLVKVTLDTLRNVASFSGNNNNHYTGIESSIYNDNEHFNGGTLYDYAASQASRPALTLYAQWTLKRDFDLSTATVSATNSPAAYTGKTIKPAISASVTAYGQGYDLAEDDDYEVSVESYTDSSGAPSDADGVLHAGSYVLKLTGTGTDTAGVYGQATCSFTVSKASGLKLAGPESYTTSTAQPFDIADLFAVTTPDGARFTDDIVATSSDEAVASVSADGTVTPHKAGTATIRLSAEGNDYEKATASFELTVSDTTVIGGGEEGGDDATSGSYAVDTKSGTATLTELDANATSVTVSTITLADGKSYAVTAVAAGAFANTQATAVTLGNSVTVISAGVLAGSKVSTLSVGTGVTTLASSVFKGSTTLRSFTGGANITTVGAGAFQGCSALTSASVISSPKVTAFGASAFSGCSKLASAAIGSKLASMGQQAFANCTSLTKVSGASALTAIGKQAFSGDKALKSFTVKSKKLKGIGASAFAGCKKLKTINIAQTTKLAKKSVKGSLKGSSVKTVNVKNSKAKKFAKFFTKGNAGKKAKVK